MSKASRIATHARKGIASGWSTDRVCIAWADYRDGSGDYDAYADFEGNTGLMSDRKLVYSGAAETVNFTLHAGSANAGRLYLMVGTMAGTDPGTPLPGGLVWIPINADDLSMTSLTLGPPVFTGFFGILDGQGSATAQLNVPASVGLPPGEIMHYAYALMGPWDFASNPVAVRIDY